MTEKQDQVHFFKELLAKEFFDMQIEMVDTTYIPRKEHEFYLTTITWPDGKKLVYHGNGTHYLMSGWMLFLDYSKYPEQKTTKDQLYDFMDVSPSTLIPTPNSSDMHVREPDKYFNYLNVIFDDVLNKYKSIVECQPFFQVYFYWIYGILHGLKRMMNGDIDGFEEITDAERKLHYTVSQLIELISNYKEYINRSIILPSEYGRRRKTGQLILEYETFLNSIGEKSCYAEASWGEKGFCKNISKK